MLGLAGFVVFEQHREHPMLDMRHFRTPRFAMGSVGITFTFMAMFSMFFVLTQYLSASLNRHIAQTYRFDAFRPGQVQVLAAEQIDEASGWYQGTADAVRKQLKRLETDRDDDVLVLSGDQMYMMDIADFVAHHRRTGADVTIAATRCRRVAAK